MRKCEYNNSALKFKIDGMSALFGVVHISDFSTLKFLMKWLEKCFLSARKWIININVFKWFTKNPTFSIIVNISSHTTV